jgi:hypothetical protein
MKSQDEIDIFVSCYHSSRTNVKERIRGCKCLSSAFFYDSRTKDKFLLEPCAHLATY